MNRIQELEQEIEALMHYCQHNIEAKDRLNKIKALSGEIIRRRNAEIKKVIEELEAQNNSPNRLRNWINTKQLLTALGLENEA